MATMQPTTTGPRSGGSRFFASPPRTPRHNHARPASRSVSRKLAPRFFRSEPVPHARFGTTQAADERPACTIFSYQTTSGYTVASNKADPNLTFTANGRVWFSHKDSNGDYITDGLHDASNSVTYNPRACMQNQKIGEPIEMQQVRRRVNTTRLALSELLWKRLKKLTQFGP